MLQITMLSTMTRGFRKDKKSKTTSKSLPTLVENFAAAFELRGTAAGATYLSLIGNDTFFDPRDIQSMCNKTVVQESLRLRDLCSKEEEDALPPLNLSQLSSDSSRSNASESFLPTHHRELQDIDAQVQLHLENGNIDKAIRLLDDNAHNPTVSVHSKFQLLSKLVHICLCHDRINRAETFARQVKQIVQKDTVQLITADMDLGMVYLAGGKVKEAMGCWNSAIKAVKTKNSGDKETLSILLNNVGVLLFLSDRTTDAIRYMKAALKLVSKPTSRTMKYGSATVHVNICLASETLDIGIKCQKYMVKGVFLYDSILSTDAHDIKASLSKHMNRSKQIKTSVSDDASIHTSTSSVASMNTTMKHLSTACLSSDLLTLGSLQKQRINARKQVHDLVSRNYLSKDLSSSSNTVVFSASDYFPDDEAVERLDACFREAVTCISNNRTKEAHMIISQAEKQFVSKHGSQHYLVGIVTYYSGMISMILQDYTSAYKMLKSATGILIDELENDHTFIAESMMQTALAQLALNEKESSFRTMSCIRDHYLNTQGFSHPRMASLTNNFGVLHLVEKSYDRARRSFEIALKYLENILKKTDNKKTVELAMSSVLCNLAFLHFAEKKSVSTSLSLYRNALEIQTQCGASDDCILETKANIDYLSNPNMEKMSCQNMDASWMLTLFTCGNVQ